MLVLEIAGLPRRNLNRLGVEIHFGVRDGLEQSIEILSR